MTKKKETITIGPESFDKEGKYIGEHVGGTSKDIVVSWHEHEKLPHINTSGTVSFQTEKRKFTANIIAASLFCGRNISVEITGNVHTEESISMEENFSIIGELSCNGDICVQKELDIKSKKPARAKNISAGKLILNKGSVICWEQLKFNEGLNGPLSSISAEIIRSHGRISVRSIQCKSLITGKEVSCDYIDCPKIQCENLKVKLGFNAEEIIAPKGIQTDGAVCIKKH